MLSSSRRRIFLSTYPGHEPEDPTRLTPANEPIARTRPGSIILLHPMYANRGRTRSALPAILAGLKAGGFRFVTVTELLAVRD